jgi:hypothetical protein
VLVNMASVYCIVAIRVNETSWHMYGGFVSAISEQGMRVTDPFQGWMSYFSVESLSPQWTEPVRLGPHPCERWPCCCHGDHGDYTCFGGRVPMPGIEELEIDT